MFDEISLLVLEGDAAGLAAKVAEMSATARQADRGLRADVARSSPARPLA